MNILKGLAMIAAAAVNTGFAAVLLEVVAALVFVAALVVLFADR